MTTERHDLHDHSTLLYNSPSELDEAVTSFFQRGLNSNKRCIYIETETSNQSTSHRIIENNAVFQAAKEDGTISVTTAFEAYLDSGVFDVDETITLFRDLLNNALDEGFGGLCVIAETQWLLKHDVDIDKWREYERRVNDFFRDNPVEGLCLYDRSQFPTEVLSDFLCSHPKVTDSAGQSVNIFYQRLAEASAQASTEDELDWMLRTVSEYSTGSDELLTALKQTVEEVNQTDQHEASKLATEIITNSLNLPVATVCIYDESDGRIKPCAEHDTPYFEEKSVTELLDEELWDAFGEGREQSFTKRLPNATRAEENTTLSGAIVPIGTHGVLVVGDWSELNTSDADRDFIRTVTGVIEAALDRREYNQALEDQSVEIERQNDRLTRLEQISQVFQNLSEELVAADSREQIQVAACEEIADAGRGAFGWVGEFDSATETLETVHTAGNPDGYFDAIVDERQWDPTEPTQRAAESRESQAVTKIRSDAPLSDWRKEALRRGVQSVISLPLLYDDELYGLLSVYFAQPDDLDAEIRAALERITGLVAQRINGTERKRAFVGDRVTEVKLRLCSDVHAVIRLTSGLDCKFELEGIVPAADDSFRIFATIDAPPKRVLEFCDANQVVDDIRVVAEQDTAHLYECTIGERCFLNILLRHNAVPQSLSASGSTAEVTLELPREKRVSEFMEAFQKKYPDADLVAKNTDQRSIRPQAGFKAGIKSDLSDRQLETLKTAYLSGYFEWPRESSAEDLADMLDVTHPTISRHLREAQRKVFSELFESE